MPTVTIKMTEAQFEALAREARARGTSKAGVLREAFLKKQTKTSGDSAYDLISDLIGSVKSPRDFATTDGSASRTARSLSRPGRRLGFNKML